MKKEVTLCKGGLLRKEENGKGYIFRILEVAEEKVLVIDCVSAVMPKWVEIKDLEGYVDCTEKELQEITEAVVLKADSLSADSPKLMHQRYTMIAGILPFVSDEKMRARMIEQASVSFNISKQTIRHYLCLYLIYQDMAVLAKPGAGKSTALIDTAHRFLKKKRQTKVIIVAPTRGLAEQMGNAKGVSCVIGGVDYNKKNKLISTTYDKLNCLFETLEIEKNKNDYQYVLIADEAHLMVTQADWKKYPIKNLLFYLKGNLFSTSLFITATPEPLTAFNFNQIIEFKSKDKAPSIDKVEIILAV